MSTPDPAVQAFLDALKADGRSSPAYWLQFYEFLQARKRTKQSEPPVPLILGASGASDATKHERLSEQLLWAHENGCIDDALRYLRALPVEQWNSCSPEFWDQDNYPGQGWHWGWTSDPKPRVSAEDASKIIERLRANWDQVAGEELRGVTSPLRLEGMKGRRLVVFARSDACPPWGSWCILPAGEKRRLFTRFRAAVNAVIKPHEVDHIDFVHRSNEATFEMSP